MHEQSLRFLTTIIVTKLYVKDGIISVRGEVLTHKTSLTPSTVFFLSTCTKLAKESERSCICVMGY